MKNTILMVFKKLRNFTYMARDRNRNNKIVKRALSRRKGYKLNNPTSYLNSKPNEKRKLSPQSLGLKSFRSNKFDFTQEVKGFSPGMKERDRHSKVFMHPEPWWNINDLYPGIFDAGGAMEGIGAPANNDGNETRNNWENTNGDGGECKFKCNGQDIWVAPGDCVRCPENSYCPDNWRCSTVPRTGSTYFVDNGFACCGCPANYGGDVDPNGPNVGSNGEVLPHGKKLGWTFTLWSGDNDCDDGRWMTHYYNARKENVIPYAPATNIKDRFGTNNDWEHDDTNFFSGPWNYADGLNITNHSTNYMLHHMFYWADNQPQAEKQYFETGTFTDSGTNIGLMGSGFAHMACAEWGYDCGDVMSRCPADAPRSGCQRLAVNTSDSMAITYPHLTWGEQGGNDCEWGHNSHITKRKELLGHGAGEFGKENDPNRHCGWTFGEGGTCKGKCNRPIYLQKVNQYGAINPYFIQKPGTNPDDGIGWDPGGIEFVTGNPGEGTNDGWNPAGPTSCFCDYQCYHCGCDYQTFALSGDEEQAKGLYKACLDSCAGDCYGPNHLEDIGDWSDEDIADIESMGKTGSIPGSNCAMSPSSVIGDCCNDWKSECYVDKPKLPCECFDIIGSGDGNPETEDEYGYDDGTGDTISYGAWQFMDCPYYTPMAGVSECTEEHHTDQDSNQDCRTWCEYTCPTRGYSMDGDVWQSTLAIQGGNGICAMEWYNKNILDRGDDWENYALTPSCTTSYAGHNYVNGRCMCACKCNEYNEIFATDESGRAPKRKGPQPSAADLGCGGLLPAGTSAEDFCNYEGEINPQYNCSVEYIESLNDAWYSANIPYGSISANQYCIPKSINNYFTDPYTPESAANGIVPRRVVQLYTLLAAYNLEGCNNSEYTNMLNGTINACEDGYNRYLTWWSGFEKGCRGCADPQSGNYTGNIIKNASGQAMDCEGNGTASDGVGNTSCCYDETGCLDSGALNYLTSDEAEYALNIPAGGLGSLNPQMNEGEVVPLTSIRFCEILFDLFTGWNPDEFEGTCAEAQYHHQEGLAVDGQENYVYCFAPEGCKIEGYSETYCSYDTVNYCNDSSSCNFSLSCTTNEGFFDSTCGPDGQNEGMTCAISSNGDYVPVRCGESDASLCINDTASGKVNFCRDSDGDCLTDIDDDNQELSALAIGCDMSGVTNQPLDAMTWYQSTGQNSFTDINGLSGYPIIYNNLNCDGGELGGGHAGYNGYPLAQCNVETESDIGLINCPSNMTHADQGDGERYCSGFRNVPTHYPGWTGDGQNKSWMGTEFLLTDCCSMSVGCLSGGNNPTGETINGVDLPCCYRDDDCGNCELPNTGIFVMTDSGAPQDGGIPLPFINTSMGTNGCWTSDVGGGMGIWDSTQTSFPIAIGTTQMYSTTNPSVSFCSCNVTSAVGCNCNIATDNNEGFVCVDTPQQLDCNSVCGGDGLADDCGVCDGPGYIENCDYCEVADTCCPDNSEYCTTIDPETGDYPVNCGIPDCNFECGGSASMTNFAQDYDGDGFCNEQHQVSYCSTGPDDYPDCDGDCPGVYIPLSQCDTNGWDANDDPEDGYCPSNNFDNCNICVGLNGHEENSDQDCHGVCFGLNQLDECGVCACPTGLEASCGEGYNTWNSTQDQCGICQGQTLMSKDILGFDVELTWGSFGCEQRDWYGENSEFSNQSGGTCGPRDEGGNGILHCGCQCAGCTNMASPAWTQHAKYPESLDSTVDWLYGDPIYALMVEGDYTSYNFCWNYYYFDIYTLAKEVVDTIYDRYGSSCSTQAINAAIDYADNPLAEKYCMFFDQEMCLSGEDLVTCDTQGSISFQEFFENVIPSNGWLWHGNLNMIHCDNDVAGGHCQNGAASCEETFGWQCCGIQDQSCRTGVRSELYWEVYRGEDSHESLDWNFGQNQGSGDINQDGIVNILDIITAIQHIMGTITLTDQQFANADLNGDGLVNILDIVSLVNQILDTFNSGGLVSRKNSLNSIEQDNLMRNLKPLFNNSIYTNMKLINSFGLPIRNSNNNTSTRTRTSYNFDNFSFLINAPECIDIENPPEVEIGDAFGGWGDVELVPMGNGLMSVGVTSTGGPSVSVDLNQGSRPLVIIYHPNVHIQADEQYQQVGTTTPNNFIRYIPEATQLECAPYDYSIIADVEYCMAIQDMVQCDLEEICEVQYVSGDNTASYELRGLFGYDFATWNPLVNCNLGFGNCIDSKSFWIPGEREELLPTEASCDY